MQMDPAIAPDTVAGVVAFARDRRRQADRAEAELLQSALWWADLHPVESIESAATFTLPGVGDTGLLLGGEGCPLVAEFSVAEFAAALGLGTESGKHLIGQALELAHRLPRTWARVVEGEVVAWRARRIAEQTIPLSFEAAGFVDSQIAGLAHTARPWQVDKLVAEAVARFMPDEADRQREQAADRRHVTIDLDQTSFAGTAFVHAELDLTDALDLDAALTAGARSLRALGSTDSLDIRRAAALGELARGDHTLTLDTDLNAETSGEPKRAREVVLFVHLSEAVVFDDGVEAECARIENTGRGGTLVTADTIRDWCGNPTTRVTVKPVIDLTEHVRVDQYEIPDRLREHTTLRDGCCVFPWCTRTARRADCDHIQPHASGGHTGTSNLAPLCRPHHRLKTHGHAGTFWTYTMLEPGSYLWASPVGLTFLRNHRGTSDVTRETWPRPPGRD
jgi:5-methylcytosine-specific restriction endonuclease McrA